MNPYTLPGIIDQPIYYIRQAAAVYGVSMDELSSRKKTRRISEARAMAWYNIRRKFPNVTLLQAANMLGAKDHATVIVAVAKYEMLKETKQLLVK